MENANAYETAQSISPSAVVTWKTTKTAAGFAFKVYTVEYQKAPVILKEVDGFKSRAIAVRNGKSWVRYFKANRKA